MQWQGLKLGPLVRKLELQIGYRLEVLHIEGAEGAMQSNGRGRNQAIDNPETMAQVELLEPFDCAGAVLRLNVQRCIRVEFSSHPPLLVLVPSACQQLRSDKHGKPHRLASVRLCPGQCVTRLAQDLDQDVRVENQVNITHGRGSPPVCARRERTGLSHLCPHDRPRCRRAPNELTRREYRYPHPISRRFRRRLPPLPAPEAHRQEAGFRASERSARWC